MKKNYPLLLSIVVPIYNVEDYLDRCIDSLLHQDIDKSDYEIILVNDGSTDESYEIAKRKQRASDNIVLISQENKGLSGARNTGLKYVRGKYLMFVDSDDFLQENVLGALLQTSKDNNLDLTFFRFYYERTGGISEKGATQNFKVGMVYPGEYLILNKMVVSSVWQNVYRSEFLFDNNVFFQEGIIHEDIDFNYRLYPLASRVMFTDIYVYHYCLYRESILRTNSPEKIKYLIVSDFYVANNIRKNTRNSRYSDVIQSLYSKHVNSIVVSNLIRLIKEKYLNSDMKRECFDTAKQLGVYPVKGKTNSWKTTLLAKLLNCECLYRNFLK